MAADETMTGGARGASGPLPRSGLARRILIYVLVLVCSVAVAITGVAWWAHYTVMDTNGYMKIVGPVGKDPEAIQSLSEYVSGQIVSLSGLEQQIGDALPSQLQGLSGSLTAKVQDYITTGAAKILATSQAYEVWLQVNRVVHEQIVALLRGQTSAVYAKGSDVNLNLLPLIGAVLSWADQQVPGGLGESSPPDITSATTPDQAIQELSTWSGEQLPSDFGQITLLQSDALGPAQTAVEWFDRLMWILPLVTAAFMAVTIWLSRRRVRTAIALAIGAVIAVLVVRGIAAYGAQYLTDQVKQGDGQGIVRQVINASLGPLTTVTIVVGVAGVAVAVAVWLLGRRESRRASA